MTTDAVGYNRREYPETKYTETLILIAAAEVLFSWVFLILIGLFPGSAIGSFASASTAVGFAIAGLGILEFGVVVLNVQLAWILPDDHQESGVAPFLCGYCLLGQVLLMFPPLIIVAIVIVPLLLISIACVGWYFQKFTSLRLSKAGSDAHQTPLSLKALLLMPVCVLSLGLLPLAIVFFCGYGYIDLAIINAKYTGVVIICSSIVMVTVSFLPLVVCYAFLFWSQCNRFFQTLLAMIVIFCVAFAIAIEAFTSNFRSGIMPLLAIALFMFVFGLWLGLSPWHNGGLRVVFARPSVTCRKDIEVKFDELN